MTQLSLFDELPQEGKVNFLHLEPLDPHYCDVIIARWEKLTGKKAERVREGMDV